MAQTRYRGPPMTLANMRVNGVRSLSVTCEVCHHEAVMNVDRFGNAIPVPAFGPAQGLHRLRHHWRIRPAEVAGASGAKDFDRRAVALEHPGSKRKEAPACGVGASLYAGSDSGKPAAFDLSGRHLRNYHNGKRIRTLPVND
jgi:hypothetical protein